MGGDARRLTAVAVGPGVAKFLPDLQDAGVTWPYVVLGGASCVLGILMMTTGIQRMRAVSHALERGEFGRMDERIATQIGALTILLAVATIAIIIFNR